MGAAESYNPFRTHDMATAGVRQRDPPAAAGGLGSVEAHVEQQLQWYHLIASTYGAWLYGDDRGFRTRHHREHVEGDYKNPPPAGMYSDRERRSRESLKRPPVVFSIEQRTLVGAALRNKLQKLGALVLCVSVSGQHAHILAKLPAGKARAWLGKAKCHAWFELRDQCIWVGQMWGKRGKELEVRDRAHQLNVYRYILRHLTEGAWVWDMMSEKNPPPPESPPAAAGGSE
jgi:hypothetical protein